MLRALVFLAAAPLLPQAAQAQPHSDAFSSKLFQAQELIDASIRKDRRRAKLFSAEPVADAERLAAFKRAMPHLKDAGVPLPFAKAAFMRAELSIPTLEDARKKALWEEKLAAGQKPPENTYEKDYAPHYINADYIEGGAAFYLIHEKELARVSRDFDIDPYLLAAFAGIETKYGQQPFTAKAFDALFTQIARVPRPPEAKMAERQIAALLLIAREHGVDPHDIGGSRCGAFGYGQFMPITFREAAVDGNGDGVRSPYDWPDVFASIANLLKRNGYNGGRGFHDSRRMRRVIMSYNNSDWYARAVVELREKIVEHAAKLRPAAGGTVGRE